MVDVEVAALKHSEPHKKPEGSFKEVSTQHLIFLGYLKFKKISIPQNSLTPTPQLSLSSVGQQSMNLAEPSEGQRDCYFSQYFAQKLLAFFPETEVKEIYWSFPHFSLKHHMFFSAFQKRIHRITPAFN